MRNNSTNMKGLTSIIILTYNQIEYTKLCVKSIESYAGFDHEIIFVDNASTDGSVDFLTRLTEKNEKYTFIKNNENLGYAAGNNKGLQSAKGEFVLILNNDVLVTEGSIDTLLQVLKEDKTTALVGPVTNFANGNQIDFYAKYNSVKEMTEYARLRAKEYIGKSKSTNRLVGFCLLGRTELLLSAGGFDEGYGIGNYEDIDLCRYFISKGYILKVALGSYVHHFGHVSFDGTSIDYNGLVERNRKRYEEKWNDIKRQNAEISSRVLLEGDSEIKQDNKMRVPV